MQIRNLLRLYSGTIMIITAMNENYYYVHYDGKIEPLYNSENIEKYEKSTICGIRTYNNRLILEV